MSNAPVRKPAPATVGKFKVTKGVRRTGEKIVIYGTGGAGKTTLASLLPSPKFIDVDSGGTRYMDVARVEPDGAWTYQLVLDALRTAELWADCETVVIDSATGLQELAVQYTFQRVPLPQGASGQGVEAYGYGKGYRFVFDSMCEMLAPLERLAESGKHVVIICHETVARVTNTMGAEWMRSEPALLKTRNENLPERLKSWCDHMLFVTYDVDVDAKTKRGRGSGTRTVYTQERPMFMAKTRTRGLDASYGFDSESDRGVLTAILGGDQ